jgi:hypothetical protein
MSSLVKWMFNAAKQTEEVWWKEMTIEAQILCEQHLQSTHRGNSKIHFCHKQVLYSIDLSSMIQQNLTTGRLRPIRRSESQFIRSERQSSPMLDIPAPPDIAHVSFREVSLCRNREEENKWKRTIEEAVWKRQTYKR